MPAAADQGGGTESRDPGRNRRGPGVFHHGRAFHGGEHRQTIRRIILVDSEEYIRLPLAEKYEVARLIGRLNKRLGDRREVPTLLMGPGGGDLHPLSRCAGDLRRAQQYHRSGEVAFPGGNLMPELSSAPISSRIWSRPTSSTWRSSPTPRPALSARAGWRTAQRPGGADAGQRPLQEGGQGLQPPRRGLQLLADVVSQRLLCYR